MNKYIWNDKVYGYFVDWCLMNYIVSWYAARYGDT